MWGAGETEQRMTLLEFNSMEALPIASAELCCRNDCD
jgi:hypothetical protein